MEQLTSLGKVEQRTERGEDVSREFVDLGARERHLEAVEIQLLGFLEETITLSVSEIDADAIPVEVVETSGDGWGVVDAWRVAANGFLTVIGGAFVVLATAGPVLLVVGIAFAGWRIVRRRRLDGAATASSGAA